MKGKKKKEEKSKTTKKMKKNDEKMKKFGFTLQNPRRFPGFTVVVVVTFFQSKSSTSSMILFSECVSFLRKINNPVLGSSRFSEEKCQFSSSVQQKYTNFTDEK